MLEKKCRRLQRESFPSFPLTISKPISLVYHGTTAKCFLPLKDRERRKNVSANSLLDTNREARIPSIFLSTCSVSKGTKVQKLTRQDNGLFALLPYSSVTLTESVEECFCGHKIGLARQPKKKVHPILFGEKSGSLSFHRKTGMKCQQSRQFFVKAEGFFFAADVNIHGLKRIPEEKKPQNSNLAFSEEDFAHLKKPDIFPLFCSLSTIVPHILPHACSQILNNSLLSAA